MHQKYSVKSCGSDHPDTSAPVILKTNIYILYIHWTLKLIFYLSIGHNKLNIISNSSFGSSDKRGPLGESEVRWRAKVLIYTFLSSLCVGNPRTCL